MNPVAEQLAGWPLEEARGRSLVEIFNIVNETTREKTDNPVEKVMRPGKSWGWQTITCCCAVTRRKLTDDSAAPIREDDGELRGVVRVFHQY